jgi:hypothetical protein
MLARVAAFELRYQLRSPLFFVGFAIFFLFGFATVASSFLHVVTGDVHVNSPYAILRTLTLMSVLALFVVTAFVANVVVRDQETRFASLLFATPLRKRDYLFGRFVGAMLVALLLLASVPLAIMIGSLMPWVDPQKVGPFAAAPYLYALLLLGLPTLLVSGAVFFALAALTRSMMWTYVGAVAFLVLYLAVPAFVTDPVYDRFTALLDPFGIGALDLVTKYWTSAERNSLLPPLTGVLLENRLVWLAVAGVMLALSYALFRFEARDAHRRKAPAESLEQAAPRPLPRQLPQRRARSAFAAVTLFEMRSVLRSPAFYLLLVIGALGTLPALQERALVYTTPLLPVTRSMIEGLQGSFTLIPFVIALYYAGELVWRERERRMHVIVDATVAPNWVFVLPKILALGAVLTGTLVAAVAFAMVFQLAHGYWQLEPLHYLLWFLLPQTISAWQLAVLAVCIQSLVPHKTVGWAVMLLLIVASITLPGMGFEHGLYRFGYAPPIPLSDMDGMARFWIARTWFEVYWSAFATMLGALAVLLWRRGTTTRLASRLALAVSGLRGAPGGVLAVAAAVWIGSGAFIYYNTNVLNDYSGHTVLGRERLLAHYEKALLPYESVPQPTIVAVKLDVQLYPRLARADTAGSYVIENRSREPISVLHVRWADPLRLLALDVEPATLEKDYKNLNYRIYRLATPLLPGGRRTLRFTTRLEELGFPNGQPLTKIVENGTFLNNIDITPQLGMSRQPYLLTDSSVRRRNGLPAELHLPKLEDAGAAAYNYARHDSGFVNAEISVTTDADQTPVAPGFTVSDTMSDGRRTVVTRTEAPVMHFFSIQSARYTIARDVWTGRDGRKVDLAVYHHPGHDHDIARILTAMKSSLDVFSERFGPYPFAQARVVECPAYTPGAQSYPGTIAAGEVLAFIQDFDDRQADQSIDLVTYGIVAHELAHQWWFHQVIGADEQGVTLLSEGFAQYSALLVMERVYGREQIRRFLKYELDRYLRLRALETAEELPLARVENQVYIHYNKASLVMYWLKESLGEEVVDRTLRRFLAMHAFKGAPYPSTTDFLALLREEAGTGHEEEIQDLFERITLYDMKAHDAVARRRADGRYEVRFTVEGRKFYADGKGTQTEAPLNEPFDVGAFTVEPGKPGYGRDSVLKIERVVLRTGTQTLTLVVDQAPRVVGVDPFNERINRSSDDNLTVVNLK